MARKKGVTTTRWKLQTLTIYKVCKMALGRVVIYNNLWLAVQMSLEGKMPKNLPIPYSLTNSQGALVFQRRNVSNPRLHYLPGKRDSVRPAELTRRMESNILWPSSAARLARSQSLGRGKGAQHLSCWLLFCLEEALLSVGDMQVYSFCIE
jgi:hypothetical protein